MFPPYSLVLFYFGLFLLYCPLCKLLLSFFALEKGLYLQEQDTGQGHASRQQLAKTERGIENMLNAIRMGIINASTKQRLDELEKRKKDIE